MCVTLKKVVLEKCRRRGGGGPGLRTRAKVGYSCLRATGIEGALLIRLLYLPAGGVAHNAAVLCALHLAQTKVTHKNCTKIIFTKKQ